MHLRHQSTEGPLPTSTFALVDVDGIYVGWVQIRHRPSCREELPPSFAHHVGYEVQERFRRKGYGTVMLALAKDEARKIGLSEIRLTCNSANIASRKIIEKNGGSLISLGGPAGRRPGQQISSLSVAGRS